MINPEEIKSMYLAQGYAATRAALIVNHDPVRHQTLEAKFSVLSDAVRAEVQAKAKAEREAAECSE